MSSSSNNQNNSNIGTNIHGSLSVSGLSANGITSCSIDSGISYSHHLSVDHTSVKFAWYPIKIENKWTWLCRYLECVTWRYEEVPLENGSTKSAKTDRTITRYRIRIEEFYERKR